MARSRSYGAVGALIILGLAASACATQAGPVRSGPAAVAPAQAAPSQDRSHAVVSGDTGGLGITGPETPAALHAIVAAPYALPDPPDCAAMQREIAALDVLLGPDVDAPPPAKAGMGHAASKAIGSAVRGAIPYRWVMRLMTQAGHRDSELRQAILAGTARRGYLKGVRQGLACPSPQQSAAR